MPLSRPLERFLPEEDEHRAPRCVSSRFLHVDYNDDLSALSLVQLRAVAASRPMNPLAPGTFRDHNERNRLLKPFSSNTRDARLRQGSAS